MEVKFCIWFANTQPAPKGTILFHCGGPSSDSDCDLSGRYTLYGPKFANDFNRVTVDQRGIGQSLPSFHHCDNERWSEAWRLQNGWYDIGVEKSDENDNKFRALLNRMATANNDCFSKNRVYQFKGPPTATFPDGQKLNWLMHSGTQELANDINMFRIAIGAEKLSMDGGSYGTAVVGVFATTFPQLLDKFVSNSPIAPYADGPSYAFQRAAGTQLQFDFQLGSCQRNEACAISNFLLGNEDLSTMINEIQAAIGSDGHNVTMPDQQFYKARFDALKSEASCDNKCKEIYELFEADESTVLGAMKRAYIRGTECEDLLGEDIAGWANDAACMRVLQDIAQGANVVAASGLFFPLAGQTLTCRVPDEIGGFNGKFLNQATLEKYVPLARARSIGLINWRDVGCQEMMFVLSSNFLVDWARDSIDNNPSRSRAQINPDRQITAVGGRCLDYSDWPNPPSHTACQDACDAVESDETCLSDYYMKSGETNKFYQLTNLNWLNIPGAKPCGDNWLYKRVYSGDGSFEYDIPTSPARLPERLFESMKQQHMCTLGGGMAVNAQDRANHFQQVGGAVKELHRAQDTFSTNSVVQGWIKKVMVDFAWNPHPVPTMGSPNLQGIVLASLYDPNTAYRWGQEMKGQFPSTSLITTAFVTHVIGPTGGNCARYNPKNCPRQFSRPCFKDVHDYVMGGEPPTDGTFCPAPELSDSWHVKLTAILDLDYQNIMA